ncbi:MAG: GNAT family N-acetyltransferase [Planctomycetota bacterium]|jgi:GNAT superfamily N-acetyltransferase
MNDTEITLRSAAMSDVPSLTKLWLEMMAFHVKREPDLALADDAGERWAKWAAGKIDDENGFVAVAERGGEIIGYVIAKTTERSDVFRERRYGEIMELAVTAAARGSGAGTGLYELAKEWVRSKGVTWLQVEVSSANEMAEGFWTRKGFKPFVARKTIRL